MRSGGFSNVTASPLLSITAKVAGGTGVFVGDGLGDGTVRGVAVSVAVGVAVGTGVFTGAVGAGVPVGAIGTEVAVDVGGTCVEVGEASVMLGEEHAPSTKTRDTRMIAVRYLKLLMSLPQMLLPGKVGGTSTNSRLSVEEVGVN